MKRFYFFTIHTALVAALLLGCGAAEPQLSEAEIMYNAASTPGIDEPKSNDERQILDNIGKLDDGQGGKTELLKYDIIHTYHAASGRVCRTITIEHQNAPNALEYRLVCQVDSVWVFVPDVVTVPN